MSAFDIFSDAARNAITGCGQVVVFRGTDREISTSAVISRSVAEIGFDARAGEARWIAELIVADVGEPRRGDLLTDSHGRTWSLREEMSGDEYAVTWSVERTT